MNALVKERVNCKEEKKNIVMRKETSCKPQFDAWQVNATGNGEL